jgi:hypothetical protein
MTPTPTPKLSADDTTLDAAVRNQLASTKIMCATLNASLKVNFNVAVANYNLNMSVGQVHSSELTVPVAPLSYVPGPPDVLGFQYPEQSGPAIVSDVAITTFNALDAAMQPKEQGVIDVGKAIPGASGWFTCGPKDTSPNGFVTPPVTSEDGVAGVFQKFGAPVGNGWYRKQ